MKPLFALFLFAGTCSAQIDKVSHFTAGASIAGAGYSITHKLTSNKWASFSVGMGLAMSAAVIKEVSDKRRYNAPRAEAVKDIAYTGLGAGVACLTLRWCF